MADIVLTGDTSGSITVAAPAVAGTNTLTLPASTGTVALTSGVGKLLKQTSLVNTTRTALSSSTDYWLSFGTVTKESATSSLIVTASVSGFQDSSGVAGVGIRIDSTYLYSTFTYSDAGGQGRTWHGNFDFGTMGGAGSKTVYWGYKPANASASRPFAVLNPTSSDDARFNSTRSTITILEVEG